MATTWEITVITGPSWSRGRESVMPPSSTVETIAAIQVLRAAAVLMVVVCHAQYELSHILGLPAEMPTAALQNLAGVGVQLFFIVSGFIMVYATEPLFGRRDGPIVFLAHRLIRIVPLYWIVTTIYLAISLAMPSFAKGYSALFVAESYLFIPAARPDGVVEPLVGQGWSLNYEMLFYVVFASTVSWPRRVAVAATSLVLVGAVAAGQRAQPLPLILSIWTQPILIYFVLGMWIGLAYRQGLRLPRIQGLALIAIGCVLMFNDLYHVVALGTGLTAWLIPAVIVTGSTLGGFILRGPVWGVLVTIGNASYALYLFQAIPVRALFYLARWTGFDIGQATSICLDGVIVVSIVLAVLIYRLLERPLTKALRGFAGFHSAKLKSAVTSG